MTRIIFKETALFCTLKQPVVWPSSELDWIDAHMHIAYRVLIILKNAVRFDLLHRAGRCIQKFVKLRKTKGKVPLLD